MIDALQPQQSPILRPDWGAAGDGAVSPDSVQSPAPHPLAGADQPPSTLWNEIGDDADLIAAAAAAPLPCLPGDPAGHPAFAAAAAAAAAQQARPGLDSPLYASDEFRINCYKVMACNRRVTHDWKTCPFVHPGEHGRRRPLSIARYDAVMCPAVRRGEACPAGDTCSKAHNVFEMWLHPDRYRTQICIQGTACTRKVCFFAHTPEELRRPPRTAGGAGSPPPGGAGKFADGQARAAAAHLQGRADSLNSSPSSSALMAGLSPASSGWGSDASSNATLPTLPLPPAAHLGAGAGAPLLPISGALAPRCGGDAAAPGAGLPHGGASANDLLHYLLATADAVPGGPSAALAAFHADASAAAAAAAAASAAFAAGGSHVMRNAASVSSGLDSFGSGAAALMGQQGLPSASAAAGGLWAPPGLQLVPPSVGAGGPSGFADSLGLGGLGAAAGWGSA